MKVKFNFNALYCTRVEDRKMRNFAKLRDFRLFTLILTSIRNNCSNLVVRYIKMYQNFMEHPMVRFFTRVEDRKMRK